MFLETGLIISVSHRDTNVCAALYCMPGPVLGRGCLEISKSLPSGDCLSNDGGKTQWVKLYKMLSEMTENHIHTFKIMRTFAWPEKL